jgi:uncharacterized protein (DUF58 family)
MARAGVAVEPAAAGNASASVSKRFDERFLRKLESLVMMLRRSSRVALGQVRANRMSKRVGAGLEFADHRDYAAGDDLRYLDWNLYGRLGRLALRLFQEEEDLTIEVLVDASASMSVGSPPKVDLALQVGAALAYVGLANLDRVAVTALGDAGGERERASSSPGTRNGFPDPPATGSAGRSPASPNASLPPARGKGAILPILRMLDGVDAAGRTALAPAVRAFLASRQRRRRGLAIVVSDFYDPAGYRAALDLLRHHRLETVAIQVSAPEEVSPTLHGDVRLRDVETGETRELTVSPAVLAAYTKRREALVRGLEGFCRERAIPCFSVQSDQPFDAVVLRMFRAGGFLR